MHARQIHQGIDLIATVHWERRLFDSLIPLPDGTSYNAYLVRGSEATALVDSTDPVLRDDLMEQLQNVEQIDYIVSQHSEQDHSGCIPELLELYPQATLVCSKKAADLLATHLQVPSERLRVVEDGESIKLGDKTLQFVYTPWVHWPETMCTYVPEDKCLFSCDFFGSHLAVYYTAHLANLLRPKLKYAAIIGSYGWGSKAIEQTAGLIPNLKADVLGTVLQKGAPTADTYAELDALAAAVAKAHRENDAVTT